jgi:putative Holliday junction resolvase
VKKRKILGVDYGDFTIGLAIFDLETDFIFPYKTIFREKANVLRKSIREIAEVVSTENITDIVVGLPLNADGTEGERVEKVKHFAHMLENGLTNANSNCRGEHCEPAIYIPITFQDERLTTAEAKTILQERGIKKDEWKKNIDQIAAEIILTDFKQVNKL